MFVDLDEVEDAISGLESQLEDLRQALFPYDIGHAVKDAFNAVNGTLSKHKDAIKSLMSRVSALADNG